MKKILYTIAVCLVVVAGSSCKKLDNYEDPKETLNGSVIDAGTGKTLQTEIGGGGTRIKLLETSWSDNPTPFYIASMQDGTFNYTKLFKGTNIISAEGAFVPLVQTGANGSATVDKSQTVEIKGTTTVNFSVDPFLRIEWVGEPVVNADGTVSASFKITRGTTDAAFQQDITDVHLFLNSNKFVGNNSFDNRYSPQIDFNGSSANAQLGQTITLTTKGGPLPTKRDYFVRVGARINYGLKYYNYTDVKTVTVP
jgi:hypothetical protein